MNTSTAGFSLYSRWRLPDGFCLLLGGSFERQALSIIESFEMGPQDDESLWDYVNNFVMGI